MRRRFQLLAALVFVSFQVFAANSPVELWRGVVPSPTGQALYRAASAQGILLIPGGGSASLGATGTNTLLISTNGSNWIVGPSTGTWGLHEIIFANGLWIAAAAQGMATSPDGTNWTVRHVSSQKFVGVAHGNGRYVAAGENFSTAISTNGTNWSEPLGNYNGGRAIAFAFGKFYVVGPNGLSSSVDGATWTSVSVPLLISPTAISFLNGRLFVGNSGNIFSTPDGVNWSSTSAGATPRSITFGNGFYVAVGESGLGLTSLNGSNWTQRSIGNFDLNGVAFLGGKFIATGTYGAIHTSSDGTNWFRHTTNVTTSAVRRISHLNGQYVAVGDQASVMTSPDGRNWTARPVASSATLRALAYGNGRYLAGGGSDLISSTNGTNWAYNGNGFSLNGLAFGNGVFVCTTDGGGGTQSKIRTSLYGTNWIDRTNFAGVTFLDATFARGLFVVGCSDGRVMTSTDGAIWTRRDVSTNTIFSLIRIVYGQGRFYALESLGHLSWSDDGTNWTTILLPVMASPQALAVGEGYVVILDTQLRVWNSRDLITWNWVRLRTGFTQYDVAYGPGQFLVSGFPGQIWQSAPFLHLAATGVQSLLISGPLGASCDIERNLDLNGTNWIHFGGVTIGDGPTPWFDPQLNAPGQAFYRATTRLE